MATSKQTKPQRNFFVTDDADERKPKIPPHPAKQFARIILLRTRSQ
jgi:hypothetical protein